MPYSIESLLNEIFNSSLNFSGMNYLVNVFLNDDNYLNLRKIIYFDNFLDRTQVLKFIEHVFSGGEEGENLINTNNNIENNVNIGINKSKQNKKKRNYNASIKGLSDPVSKIDFNQLKQTNEKLQNKTLCMNLNSIEEYLKIKKSTSIHFLLSLSNIYSTSSNFNFFEISGLGPSEIALKFYNCAIMNALTF